MPTVNVIGFSENIAAMTNEEGLAFIERTRRQLDRFDVALPATRGERMPPAYDAEIRRICDEVEASIRKHLGTI